MINKVILMGRLTRDPEVRHTSTGKAVCSFSIAIDNGYGENRQTDFINCVAWQNQAEFLGSSQEIVTFSVFNNSVSLINPSFC